MSKISESSKWRKLLATLVGAAITALGVYNPYVSKKEV